MKIHIETDLSDEQACQINEIAERMKLPSPDVLHALAVAGLTYAINRQLAIERERAGVKAPQAINWGGACHD